MDVQGKSRVRNHLETMRLEKAQEKEEFNIGDASHDLSALATTFQTMPLDTLIPILESVVRYTENPIFLDQMLQIADLYEISIFFLINTDTEAHHVLFLQILAGILNIPGSIARFDSEILAQIFRKVRDYCITEASTVDPFLPFSLLRLMSRFARPPQTPQFFKEFVPFLESCIEPTTDPRIASEAFVVSKRVAFKLSSESNDKPWTWFTTRQFIDRCISHIACINPQTFQPVCSFFGCLSRNNTLMVPLVPDRYRAVHVDVFERIDDPTFMTVYLKYLDQVSLNEKLLGKFVDVIAKKIINIIENSPFSVSRMACKLFDSIIVPFGDVIEAAILEWGTLDFIVKFFETEDVDVIDNVLGATSVMVNRYLHFQEWTPMVQVVGNSGTLIETLREMQFGEGPLHDLVEQSPTLEEAIHMTLEGFENALNKVEG